MTPVRALTVDRPGERLDATLRAALPTLSRRLVARIIAEGIVHVNGRPAGKGVHLRVGDRITLPDLPARLAPEPDLALPVVHEDATLAVVDKPGGMASHALDPRERGTAAGFTLGRWPETAAIGDALAPGLVHRLDGGTSGLLLVARTVDAHTRLRAALRARAVEKRYLAVVVGAAHDTTIDRALSHAPGDPRIMTPSRPGHRAWPAETRLRLVAGGSDRSLVLATIRTGVTHQVRAHLALLGWPVVGDTLYGAPPDELPTGRHALHAAELTFPHPGTGEAFTVTSQLPSDLQALLRA